LLNLRFFASHYFDHDAFMHLALHILDAPACRSVILGKPTVHFTVVFLQNNYLDKYEETVSSGTLD